MSNILLKTAQGKLLDEGYCIVPDVMNQNDVSMFANLVDTIAAAETRSGEAWFSHGNQRIFMLLNKGEPFLQLVGHSVATSIVSVLLGQHFLLSSLTANIALPGNSPQGLHADQGYIPGPWCRAEAVNVIWVLDDFEDFNGATRIVPRSHLATSNPSSADIDTVPIIASAGSVVCLDGRVWHGTGRNRSATKKRRAIFGYYCRPYIRQQENITRSLLPDVRNRLSLDERQLLGFGIWEGLGAVNGLPVAWMDGRERIGPTNADSLFA